MLRSCSTRDIAVGDRIDLPGRGVIVTDVQPDGISVMWFTPDAENGGGLGPFHAVLPHGMLHKLRYHDERLGQQESFWDHNVTITGRTAEV